MRPFVVSLAPSVATVKGQGLLTDALVVALTELQRLETIPAKLAPVTLPVPLAEFVILPCSVQVIQVNVLTVLPSLFVAVRTTLPTLTAWTSPVYWLPCPALHAVPLPTVEQIVAADTDEVTSAVRAIAATAAKTTIFGDFMRILSVANTATAPKSGGGWLSHCLPRMTPQLENRNRYSINSELGVVTL